MSVERIKVLPGLESVRLRPGMFIGELSDGSGLHHLVWEVVGNVVDLHLARLATEVRVDVTDDGWVEVSDDGPGISTDVGPGSASVLETEFTTLSHRDPTSTRQVPHVHLTPSVRGVGVCVVNALSTRTEVETTRDGTRWAIAFERGLVAAPLERRGATAVDGTRIRFRPDPGIFASVQFDLDHIRDHLQRVAWLSPLLRVFFQGRRLHGRGGLRAWAAQLAGGAPEAMYSAEQTVDDVYVDIALAWRGDLPPRIDSFVNMQPSRDHGTHVRGLFRAFAACARDMGVTNVDFRRHVEPGLVALVHVGLYEPRWGNPTKDQLISPVAGTAVGRVLCRHLVGGKRLHEFFARRLGRG